MKLIDRPFKRRTILAAATFSAALLLGPAVGWSTHVPDGSVSGEITSLPSSSQIEIGHHSYRIQQDSPASTMTHNVSVGERVQLILNGPANDPKSQVISIIVLPKIQPTQS